MLEDTLELCSSDWVSINTLTLGEYIHFYNHQRIQLKTKLTPLEMRSQFIA
ncbi:MAG: IS3 family transposase [Clostridia bacterium]|nr:IS3 family transposase [Clostridia bacterium]